MMRLPKFKYVAAKSVREVTEVLAGEGPSASVLAGGTDLFPNMKRRQQTPRTVVGLKDVEELRRQTQKNGMTIGSMTLLSDLAEDEFVGENYRALRNAASFVATPQIRNMATLGGNLCIDTRCNYYDQTYEWRKSIDFCMKKDGKICWVAPSSPRCWAVSSTDTAPVIVALGGKIHLTSKEGEREVAAEDFYADDGIRYMKKKEGEIVTSVSLPAAKNIRSAYLKLRRRGSFDFPVLGVAVAAEMNGKVVENLRIVLGAVESRPIWLREAEGIVKGKELTDDRIEEVADVAKKIATPLDNTDFQLLWRKKMVHKYVVDALKEIRGR